jgi:uncharacterized membrane protein HdeD (DUF308 family)
MTRYETMVVLIKAVGVYSGLDGLTSLAQAFWYMQFAKETSGITSGILATQSGYFLAAPVIYLAMSPALIFGAPLLARLCGERKNRARITAPFGQESATQS